MFHPKLTSPASSCARPCPARKHNPIIAKVIVLIIRMAIIGKITYRWDDIESTPLPIRLCVVIFWQSCRGLRAAGGLDPKTKYDEMVRTIGWVRMYE